MAAVEDYVPVFVPTRHLSQVYAYVATLDGDDRSVQSHRDVGDGDWSAELIERQFRDSPESIQALQRHLAAHPSQEFGTEELAEVMGLEHGWNSVAGALGAYGRRVKNRYKRDSWPFEFRWSREKWGQVYSMTPEVAEIIAAI